MPRRASTALPDARNLLLATLRRREFALLLAAKLRSHREEWSALRELQSRYDAEMLDAANDARPKGRKRFVDPAKAREALPKELVEQRFARWMTIAGESSDRASAERRQIDERLRALAAETPPRRGESRLLFRTCSATDHATQGHGAGAYARAAAERAADQIRDAGIDAEIVRVDRNEGRPPEKRCDWYLADRFDVFALVESPLDLELIRRAPGPPLREIVRRMWARGENPRVAIPFLPHGYEEREGLDFFGNDLRAAGKAGKFSSHR